MQQVKQREPDAEFFEAADCISLLYMGSMVYCWPNTGTIQIQGQSGPMRDFLEKCRENAMNPPSGSPTGAELSIPTPSRETEPASAEPGADYAAVVARLDSIDAQMLDVRMILAAMHGMLIDCFDSAQHDVVDAEAHERDTKRPRPSDSDA